ncbi:Leukotriene A-4 hydrolase-like protein [Rhynchospora pubera]|uniref:Leukotriene A-4 hydrolase-like protein n=1 Tax=Rhynchospora pubera TaxID=906938 RepID=A0AAV8F3F8_9POAL|nr:Leukotriene A-4 hydrolase-like protein [Rhynchospora pubera]
MAPVDPHSYADGESPLTSRVALILYLDFATCSLHGSALLTLSAPHSGPLSLDTRSLTIHSAIDPTSLSPIPFSVSQPDPVLGSRLSLSLPAETPLSSILISFSTSSSSALHFLSSPFPYAGMENPRMVFLTPTVIKGDPAGAHVVAHELAHSWTGNLITNKTNEDFWLNEGFTTYAERRIVEVVQGEERAALSMGRGWRELNRTVERFRDNMEFTKLKPCMQGIDPDDVYSQIPYEKGFQFLWRIERQVGRPVFDKFTKKYISTFKFQSIDTETFIDFLKANVPGIENQIDLRLWVEGIGIPPDAMEPVSAVYNKIKTLASEFKNGQMSGDDEVVQWNGQEWQLYLENLSSNIDPSQALALDARYRLSGSRDWEVKVAFLELAISAGCKEYFAEAERLLKQVGRMRYLRLLYTALAKCSDEGKMLARRIYAEARNCYHPIAQGVVESILSKHA